MVWVEYRLTAVIVHFTARRSASAVLAVVVCLSVRLSHAVIVYKRLSAESRKQRHTIAQGYSA